MIFYNYETDISLNIESLDIIDLLKKREDNISCCPHCKNTDFIKYGYYKILHRFKCSNKICSKTFCATTKSPWSYTKKSFELWKDYFKLMAQHKTIAQCAEILNIDTTTAFYWRHKILSAMKFAFKPDSIQNFVELKKNCVFENFKGNRKYLKKEINEANTTGIHENERRKIWIVSAIDICNTIISEPVSIEYISVETIRNTIYKKIPKDTYISTSKDTRLKVLERNHNKNLEVTQEKDTNLALPFTSRMPGWFNSFNNVSSKYLNSYLTWYIIHYQKYSNNFYNFIENLTLENSFTRVVDFKSFKLTITSQT